MGLNFRNVFMKLLLVLCLMPGLAFASTEFKGKETVNINKADAATMAAYLKGVGANKAEAIVKYRKANGRFSKIDDLKNVPGIGDETFKDMKKNVSTSRGKSKAPEGYKIGKSSGKSKSTKKKSSSSSKKSTSSKKKSSSDSSSSKKSSSKSNKKDSDSKSSKSSKAKKTKDKKTSKSKKSSKDKSKKTKSKKKSSKKKTKKDKK